MKNTLSFCSLLIICFFSACGGKSEAEKKAAGISSTVEKTSNPQSSGNFIKATIDGKEWTASKIMTDNEPSSNYKLVHGQTDDFTISFYIYKPQTGSKTAFSEDRAAQFGTSDDFFGGRKGELTVTKADDQWVEGTFNFTATSKNGSDKVYEITNGSFKVKATREN